jgi:multidrug resistance efflux pump
MKRIPPARRRRFAPGRTVVWEAGKVLALVAVLIALMLWLSGVFSYKVRADGPPSSPASGTVSSPPDGAGRLVAVREFPLIVEQVGTVRTRAQAQVASRIMAQVLDVNVYEGQAVTGPRNAQGAAAAVLARLDARDIEAKLRQAQTQVTAAEQALAGAAAQLAAAEAQHQAAQAQTAQAVADFNRSEALFAEKVTTEQQRDRARAQKDVAQAQDRAAAQQVAAVRSDIARLEAQKEQATAAVREAQVMLSFTTIEAPLSGRVVSKMIDPGDMVTPGQPLFLIETPSEPELHAVVAESLAASLKPGQTLDVRIDAIRQTLPGTVREIVPQADPRTRTLLVKVSLPPRADLVSGQFGTIAVPTGVYEALVIPSGAVRRVGQLQLVDVLDNTGAPRRRFVTLGRTHDEMVEVLSGLRRSERIVIP